MMEAWHDLGLFEDILPISALEGDGTHTLLDLIFERLSEGAPEFEEDLLTPHSERFLVAERIREKTVGVIA